MVLVICLGGRRRLNKPPMYGQRLRRGHRQRTASVQPVLGLAAANNPVPPQRHTAFLQSITPPVLIADHPEVRVVQVEAFFLFG